MSITSLSLEKSPSKNSGKKNAPTKNKREKAALPKSIIPVTWRMPFMFPCPQNWLIKIEDFEKQLTTLMENENVRRAIASRAIQESYKFSLDQIAVKWDEIFNKLNTCKRG